MDGDVAVGGTRVGVTVRATPVATAVDWTGVDVTIGGTRVGAAVDSTRAEVATGAPHPTSSIVNSIVTTAC